MFFPLFFSFFLFLCCSLFNKVLHQYRCFHLWLPPTYLLSAPGFSQSRYWPVKTEFLLNAAFRRRQNSNVCDSWERGALIWGEHQPAHHLTNTGRIVSKKEPHLMPFTLMNQHSCEMSVFFREDVFIVLCSSLRDLRLLRRR